MYITYGKVFGGTPKFCCCWLFPENGSISERIVNRALTVHATIKFCINKKKKKKKKKKSFSPCTKSPKLSIGFKGYWVLGGIGVNLQVLAKSIYISQLNLYYNCTLLPLESWVITVSGGLYPWVGVSPDHHQCSYMYNTDSRCIFFRAHAHNLLCLYLICSRPEGLGVVTGAMYLIVMFLFIPVLSGGCGNRQQGGLPSWQSEFFTFIGSFYFKFSSIMFSQLTNNKITVHWEWIKHKSTNKTKPNSREDFPHDRVSSSYY